MSNRPETESLLSHSLAVWRQGKLADLSESQFPRLPNGDMESHHEDWMS